MLLNLEAPLRKALGALEAERQGIERQIAVVRAALEALGGKAPRTAAPPASSPQTRPAQRQLSAAARRAVSQRMKAYWAKRRSEAAKSKAPGGK
jgi:hypothetical protein